MDVTREYPADTSPVTIAEAHKRTRRNGMICALPIDWVTFLMVFVSCGYPIALPPFPLKRPHWRPPTKRTFDLVDAKDEWIERAYSDKLTHITMKGAPWVEHHEAYRVGTGEWILALANRLSA